MKTIENLHNLHFKETKFFSKKWKDKEMFLRQITYDTSTIFETWFALNETNLDLFIYFEEFGMVINPRFLKIGKMPTDYKKAISYIYDVEIRILSIVDTLSYDEIKNIKTGEKLLSLTKLEMSL